MDSVFLIANSSVKRNERLIMSKVIFCAGDPACIVLLQ